MPESVWVMGAAPQGEVEGGLQSGCAAKRG